MDLTGSLAREIDLDQLLQQVCDRLRAAMHCERATLWLIDAEASVLVSRVALSLELPELRQPLGHGFVGVCAATGETIASEEAQADSRFDPAVDRKTGYVTRNVLVVPIREHERAPIRGVVQLLNQERSNERALFTEDDRKYVGALASQLARALDLTTLRARGTEPGVVLRGPFNRIIGQSPTLARVYERVQRAAETDVTVLIRGETGTGKGLLARAIHVNSPRQRGPFVTVDATTLPKDLVESELFGHERGAFTGADRRVLGRVELAEGGTLFLDEIGDLSLESQGKLLRLLQERSFERVGGRQTVRADVRFVCATFRDLEEAVRKGTFREDLFYRLRVVEIEVPPLRDRGMEDRLALATHFADVYAERYGRPTPTFAPDARAQILAHAFPGNVRELEHWVECAVVLSPSGLLTADLFPAPAGQRAAASHAAQSPSEGGRPGAISLPLGLRLEEATHRYIEATLEAARGNRTLAARQLGVSRSTLLRLARAEKRRRG
jgi:Nif-specific regulatory protein